MLVSHVKLKSGLIVDLSQVKAMISNYLNRVKRVLPSTLNPMSFGYLLTSLCEIEILAKKLEIPLPQLNLLIWQGLNQYFVLLSK